MCPVSWLEVASLRVGYTTTWWQRCPMSDTELRESTASATASETRSRADTVSRQQISSSATLQVSTPDPFSFSRPDEWPRWIRRFERFRIASGLAGKDDETQVNALIYTVGDQADDILASFSLSAEESKTYGIVKSKFDNYFVKRRNVIYERAKFNMRRQREGESVDAFVTSLYALAEHCQYGALHDEMIRDRIVVGIRNAALSERMQLQPDLDLEKAITQARQSEAVKQQQPLLRGGPEGKPDIPVGAVHRSTRGRGRQRPRPGQTTRQNSTATLTPQAGTASVCSRCGRTPAHDRQHCPARDVSCHKCGKIGHFQSVCRSARVSNVDTGTDYPREDEVNVDTGTDYPSEDEAFLGGVEATIATTSSNPWTVTVNVNGTPLELHIDTGAEVTVIPEQAWTELGQPALDPPDRTLRGPSACKLPTLGKFSADLSREEQAAMEVVYVVKGLHKPLLGCPAIEKLSLVSRISSVEEAEQSPADMFPQLFTGLGKMKGEYRIQLREGAQPFALSTPRRVAIPLMKSVEKELQRMEALGVIAKVHQPTEWCAGMVVVPKANDKVRVCVDLTKLNESVKRERHPLPAVDQTLAQLAGAAVFSQLDANSGFWQIALDPASALLTTFITPFGRFCFHRLPFGITSAPEHFQCRMSEILNGIPGVVCMMDDVLIHGTTLQEHDGRLRQVLERLQEAGVTLNKEKCRFAVTTVKFLGHVIDQSGIRPDPDKVNAIQKVRTPGTVGEVRRFLGMINQLAKFSPNLAEETKPLRDLLVKGNAWLWTETQQRAFEKIKRMLMVTPVLALFDPNLNTIVSADASSFGLGAVLLQRQLSGELKPVAFISRSMTPMEQRYAQIEKEALAFTWACDRLSDYLIDLSFSIQTDHKPLVPLFSSKHLEELPIRIQRFRLRMMRFHYSICHVPGKKLVIADTLSRAPAAGPTSEDDLFQHETNAFLDVVLEDIPATEQRIQEIRELQLKDPACQHISEYCQSGWPDTHSCPDAVRPYLPVAAELYEANNLLLRGSRIVIPPSLREEMLGRIHSAHQGITKCRERARRSVWWPGISQELARVVQNCRECCKAQTQRAQPLTPSPLPELPWQKVATDLFQWKQKTFLLIVDYYSRFIEIARLTNATAEEVVTHTKSIFA